MISCFGPISRSRNVKRFHMPCPTQTMHDVARPHWAGNGHCDRWGGYTTAVCGWDGVVTAVSTRVFQTLICAGLRALHGTQNVDKNGNGRCLGRLSTGKSPADLTF